MAEVLISDNLDAQAHGRRCLPGECEAACCPGGVWVDLLEVQRILDHAPQLRPFLAPAYAADEDAWFADEDHEHPDFPSGIAIPTAIAPRVAKPGLNGCIFLRDDHLCALHVASEALGLGWPGLKPLECATYPVRWMAGVVAYDSETADAHPHADCQRRGTPTASRAVVFRTEVDLAIGAARARKP